MTTHKRTYLPILALAVTLVAGPALAQDAKDAKDTPSKLTGSVTVAAQTGSGMDTSSKLQQYETVPKGLTLLDANIDWTSGKFFVGFTGSKLGQNDQSALFQAGRTGSFRLKASLNQNQRWFSNTAETLYSETSPGVYRLPDGMRAALQKIWYPYTTGGETAAPSAPYLSIGGAPDDRFWSVRDYMSGAQPVDLKYIRKVGNIGLDLTAIENVAFKLSYQQDSRKGHQPVAFTAPTGIDEIANAIQYRTQDWRAEVEYAHNKLFANAAFTYSRFTNDVLYSTVDNPTLLSNTSYWWTATPATVTNNSSTARIWNAPSNKATGFDLTAGYQLPAHHKVTATYSSTTMTNDQAFIAQSTNPSLLSTSSALFSLTPEYASSNGKLAQTLWMVNASGEPSKFIGYSLFYRSFDLKDKAPAYTFHSTVNSDAGGSYSATGTSTDDAGFKTGQFKAEAHVTPLTGFKIGVNFNTQKNTYADRDYLDTKDTTYGVTVDANLHFGMFHGSYSSMTRKPGDANPDAVVPFDPTARWKDIARQDAKLYSATLTVTPFDNLSAAIFVSGINSKFPETGIGLTATNVRNYGVDLVYALNDKFTVNAGYIYEKFNTNSNFWYSPNGNGTTAATNTVDQYWNATDDVVHTYKAGFRWNICAKAEFGSDYDYSKGTSDSGFTVTPGGVAGGDIQFPTATTSPSVFFGPLTPYLNYPQVFNATTIWKTWFNYHLDKNVTLGLLFWHQKFDQADWAYDQLSPYMLGGSALYASTPGAAAAYYPNMDPSANKALFLGATVPNYNANIFRVSLGWRF